MTKRAVRKAPSRGRGASVAMPRRPHARFVRCISDADRPEIRVTDEYLQTLQLIDRDRMIIQFIHELGYVTSQQIARLFWGHCTNPNKPAGRRLLILWKKHVLNRMQSPQLIRYGLPSQLVYTLGKAGRALMREVSWDDKVPRQRSGGLLVTHNVLMCEAITRILIRLLSHTWEAQVFGERQARATFTWDGMGFQMRPDGMLLLTQPESGREVSLFIEMDTGTRPLKDYDTKIRQYDYYFKSGTWKQLDSAFPAVLVCVWKASSNARDTLETISATRVAQVAQRVVELRKERNIRWFVASLEQIDRVWTAVDKDSTVREKVDLLGSLINESQP